MNRAKKSIRCFQSTSFTVIFCTDSYVSSLPILPKVWLEIKQQRSIFYAERYGFIHPFHLRLLLERGYISSQKSIFHSG